MFRHSADRARERASSVAHHAEPADAGLPDLLELVLARRFGAEFQPIVEVRSERVVAYEALSRFHDEAGELLSPGLVFARLHAEPSLLLHVELEMKALQLANAPAGPLHVNVDPDSFALADDDAGNALLRMLAGARAGLVVEVIENMTVADAELGGAMVRELDRAGISIALDDVGRPDALLSLEALKLADVLKLDSTWVRRATDPIDRAILDALLGLARRLGARTVLEGVETTEDLAVARELGVDCAQGYLFRDGFVAVWDADARRRRVAPPPLTSVARGRARPPAR
jgi:EAL domain-containing protein (putative c-di-GMP-specific phosphodiesterase class I)